MNLRRALQSSEKDLRKISYMFGTRMYVTKTQHRKEITLADDNYSFLAATDPEDKLERAQW